MSATPRSSFGLWSVVVLAAVLTLPSRALAELVPLGTAAALSPRPRACSPQPGLHANVWRGARSASGSLIAEVCARLAQVTRLLVSEPAAAAELSTATRKLVGTDAQWRGPAALRGPWLVIEARVEVANGQAAPALEMFHRAAARRAISEWDPGALRDYATSAVAAGSYVEAVGLYRRLVAISAWLDQPTRTSVRLEAAFAVLRLERPDVSEALGYLAGLDAPEADASATALAGVLVALAQTMAGVAAPETMFTLDVQHLPARLADVDRRLVSSWQAWQRDRDLRAWDWVGEPGVPAPYRALAERCIHGGK